MACGGKSSSHSMCTVTSTVFTVNWNLLAANKGAQVRRRYVQLLTFVEATEAIKDVNISLNLIFSCQATATVELWKALMHV